MAATIPIIATTIRSSIRVNPLSFFIASSTPHTIESDASPSSSLDVTLARCADLDAFFARLIPYLFPKQAGKILVFIRPASNTCTMS
jgi:hypothetical protein